MDKKIYPHRDHRQRVRAQFRKNGTANMPDAAILELLLFYAIPRKDTKPLADLLLSEYGSLKGVAGADVSALEKIDGLGENSALLLSMLGEISKRVEGGKLPPVCLTRHEDIIEKICLDIKDRENEVFYAACLNSLGMMTAGKVLCEGGPDGVTADKRAILEFAFSQDADKVIIAHNHPNAPAAPSPEDIALTIETGKLLAETGIALSDHIITGTDGFLSLAHTGKFANLFDKI